MVCAIGPTINKTRLRSSGAAFLALRGFQLFLSVDPIALIGAGDFDEKRAGPWYRKAGLGQISELSLPQLNSVFVVILYTLTEALAYVMFGCHDKERL